MMFDQRRLDAEWLAVNAVRESIKLSTYGDNHKANYENSLNLGGHICPEILGQDVSIIRRSRETDLTKEYRQKAKYKSFSTQDEITALSLVKAEIREYEALIEISKRDNNNQEVDKLKNRLKKLYKSEEELSPEKSSENQLIFRDALKVDRGLPMFFETKNSRYYETPHGSLAARVLHPERAEHILGADLIYERFDARTNKFTLAFIQYKIWEDKKLYLSDDRMLKQIEKMRNFSCDKGMCEFNYNKSYRFPYCCSFIRPTDKLQSPDQKLISSGEHLPICFLESLSCKTDRGALVLSYEGIKSHSLSHDVFEYLFNNNKVGSISLDINELAELYKDKSVLSRQEENLILYIQEYPNAKR